MLQPIQRRILKAQTWAGNGECRSEFANRCETGQCAKGRHQLCLYRMQVICMSTEETHLHHYPFSTYYRYINLFIVGIYGINILNGL